MRERTTWDRNEIAKQAAGHAKKADPYTMNQPEHAKAQPAADAYVTGTPSDFAEDVHPSSGTWEAEYSGGQVKRNEIGMPEMRSDTFNHAEKTASEEVLVKKAALCVRVARCVLPKTASEAMVEDQALAFMHLPNEELISTYNRLAADDEKKEAEGQQEQAKQAQDDKKQAEGQQEQGKQAQAQDDKKQAEGQQEQAKQAQQDDKKQAEGQQESKQAGEMPPQFKENAEKKKEEAEAKKDDGQEKKAQGDLSQIAQCMQAMQQGDMKQAEQALQAAVQQMAQQLMQQMAQGQQQPAQQQAPMAEQQQMAPTSDDQLLDQMLAEGQPQQQAPMAEDIELEAPSMDVGAEQLDPVADAQLMQLFANGEAQQAEQAKQASHGVRTASTRTVGARPTNGVSRLGGVVASTPAASGGRDLSSIWNSAPDVSDVFGIPKG